MLSTSSSPLPPPPPSLLSLCVYTQWSQRTTLWVNFVEFVLCLHLCLSPRDGMQGPQTPQQAASLPADPLHWPENGHFYTLLYKFRQALFIEKACLLIDGYVFSGITILAVSACLQKNLVAVVPIYTPHEEIMQKDHWVQANLGYWVITCRNLKKKKKKKQENKGKENMLIYYYLSWLWSWILRQHIAV